MAALLALKEVDARRATYSQCLFGIADLVVTIMMGAMTSLGRAHVFALAFQHLCTGIMRKLDEEWEPTDRLNPA